MKIKDDIAGVIDISGSLTKAVKKYFLNLKCIIMKSLIPFQKEEIHSYEGYEKTMDDFHLMKIGKLVEDMETNLRNTLDEIYVGKTKEVFF